MLPHLPLGIRNVASFQRAGLEPATGVIHERRSATSSTTSSTPCTTTGNSDTCQKPTDATATLPIALGVVIPLTLAFTAFIILHRRYKKKLAAEDMEDAEKYKSMDFGTDLRYGGKGKKGKKGDPEMAAMGGVQSGHKMRGLSLDDQPYLFPAARNSQESLVSITRSVMDADHRYQLHAFGKEGDISSIRSQSALVRRGTESTDGADAHLVGHAQAFGKSAPPRGNLGPADHGYPSIQEPEKAMIAANQYAPPRSNAQGGLAPTGPDSRESFVEQGAFRKSNNYLGSFINSREPSMIEEEKPAPKLTHLDSSTSTLVGSPGSDTSPKISITEPYAGQTPMAAPRHSPAETALPVDPRGNVHSMVGSVHDANTNSFVQAPNTNSFVQSPNTNSFMTDSDSFIYGDTSMKVTAPSVRDSDASDYTVPTRGQSLAAPLGEIQEQRESMYLGEGLNEYSQDNQRLSVLMRPLPHDDPTENPEERANRIRSFYKEYFDDTKGGAPGQAGPPPPMPPQRTNYYEDYDTEYLNNAYTVYDTQQQGFVVGGAPFAQPITRRAMTPPPRAPPRNFRARASSQASQSQYGGRGPPRGQSSMSNFHSQGPYSPGVGSERGRTQKRNLPPPAPLMSLKTPHLLKDDSALYTTMDLAPPPSFRDRQAGRRPDSPGGVERPYSPVVRAYTPLQGAYEDLSPMPSPHLLRRSGTFTALDFAPPSKFRNDGSGSDAGSVRSGRSGMSHAQQNAIRAGAHRISRLPKDLAGTKDDLMTSLKPKWDLNY
ncbi:hypothetical protein EG328_001970 [Venturia inaequalis]|uniref:Uncharacterized protein n=1 Tax=Venturia inaequalis TaxID=5025 RepID=A0A8H3UUR9_VENIN|nr:hypothetical protein EG328_001970 [Venturia inaequalis]KAE9990555.1 hypothetical protein EG327_001281 [Venturia inaequalis]